MKNTTDATAFAKKSAEVQSLVQLFAFPGAPVSKAIAEKIDLMANAYRFESPKGVLIRNVENKRKFEVKVPSFK